MTCLYSIFAAVFFAMGWFIFRYPNLTIRLQQKFYALINWRMEPIDMDKEIRNTRAMGLFLIFFILLSTIWMWVKG
ncbi:MAG TPA: hypothetical protein VLJ10_05325 [Candidatus Bathyarchaeia archaeon]|nr:hypothetical protein [Candidatus Bathyarchaeia archaeon]